jgi:hypothetical protein
VGAARIHLDRRTDGQTGGHNEDETLDVILKATVENSQESPISFVFSEFQYFTLCYVTV